MTPSERSVERSSGDRSSSVGQDGVGVGAELGGGPQRDVGSLQAERLVEQQHAAVDGVLDLLHEATLAQVRVLEDVVGVHHGRRGDAGAGEQRPSPRASSSCGTTRRSRRAAGPRAPCGRFGVAKRSSARRSGRSMTVHSASHMRGVPTITYT